MKDLIGQLTVLTCALCSLVEGSPSVLTGSQVLRDGGFAPLRGHRVAMLSNPTGVFPDSMEHIVDMTARMPGLDVVAIFGPEHGFRGELQAETGDPLVYVDNSTGLPVFSVYKMSNEAIRGLIVDMNITAVVVDMQDVGVRLYTFIWTMYNVMEAGFMASAGGQTSEGGLKLLVCDRPNPLGGEAVDGPLLNMSCCASGYGKAPITHVHGMTIGELALYFRAQLATQYHQASVDLEVVEMVGWSRSMGWQDTGLPWVPPSPNVPTVQTAVAYPATCFLEATTVAEGRGTTTPFEQFGAPFLSSQDMSAYFNSAFACPKARACFRAAYFQPTFSKYNNTAVPAVQWLHERMNLKTPSNGDAAHCWVEATEHSSSERLDTPASSMFEAGVVVLVGLKNLSAPPDAFVWDGSWFGHPGSELIDMYAGTPLLRELIDAGASAADIVDYFATDSSEFVELRKPYLLYL